MMLIPAIDLKAGQCVRLRCGDMDTATVFSDDPAKMARHWVTQGAMRLHLVDLDGACAGSPQNGAAIRAIIKEVGADVSIQIGGGIRDLSTIEGYLNQGLSDVVIGTAAVEHPGFLQQACAAFGGHIMVGLDAKGGKVATHGWRTLTDHNIIDLMRRFEEEEEACRAVIYTDIGRDGMLQGMNIEATVQLAHAVSTPVIASGGLANLADIEALARAPTSIAGIICGRALYTGAIDFAKALAIAGQQTLSSTPKPFSKERASEASAKTARAGEARHEPGKPQKPLL